MNNSVVSKWFLKQPSAILSLQKTYFERRHQLRHGVSQIAVVLYRCLLEELQHGGTVLRRVEHQDQDTNVCSTSRIYDYCIDRIIIVGTKILM